MSKPTQPSPAQVRAALRHAGRMTEWGLALRDRKRLEAGHQEFVMAALAAR